MIKEVALKIRPSQHRLQMIKDAIDEKHTIREYDEDGKLCDLYHCDRRDFDDYLLNEMIVACKGRDLSNTRLKNNRLWKLWLLDLTPEWGNPLYSELGYICEDAVVIRHKK